MFHTVLLPGDAVFLWHDFRKTMAHRERILIGCPHYQMFVTGSYECDAAGRYLLRPDGTFDIYRAKCGQRGGQCDETLCFLHRYNRRHAGTWYPTEIMAHRTAAPYTPKSDNPQPEEGDLF
ncbi:MAG: hypothetical protein JXA11_12845 [Phycisphaerae bacterium]|nr:hypothetical protein [Phycisphaerae bacterium]